MNFRDIQKLIKRLAVPVFAIVLLSGCTSVGPRSITAGRVAYAEAINQTQDEQILLSIVKGRYGESSTLLAVSGVAANLKFRAEAGIEAGFNGVGNVGDDLLIGGIAYEENPTITYTPLQGEDYVKQLMSPIPIDLLLLIVRSTAPDLSSLTLLVSRINNLRNPDFISEPTAETEARFKRLVELLTELSRTGALDLVKSTDGDGAFNIWLDPQSEKDAGRVTELLALLEIPPIDDGAEAVIIPVFFGIRGEVGTQVGIITRSTFDLIEMMRAAVDVPEAHEAAGYTETYPQIGLAGRGIRIHSSARKPKRQSPTVQYRGYWFWIDDADLRTKKEFRILRTLWSITISGATDHTSAPILTLPVGN